MIARRADFDQPARAFERLDLLDHRHIERPFGLADVVAVLLLDLVAGDRGDELVAAHPDRAVDAPDRDGHAVLAKGAVPGHGVLVVGVDEGAVDVEDDACSCVRVLEPLDDRQRQTTLARTSPPAAESIARNSWPPPSTVRSKKSRSGGAASASA